jgi:hypothetical protein
MSALLDKPVLGALAIALTFIGTVPYVYSTLRGTTRPHVFSWVAWALTTTVVFFAQLQGQGGIGAWPTGVSALLTGCIAVLAWLKRGDVAISRSDGFFFAASLSSLPLWYLTADPLWAIVILTTVDVLGFAPTVRKAYHAPRSEPPVFYAIFALRNLTAILALEHHSLTTVLFPAVLGLVCLFILGLLLWRRAVLTPISAEDFS